MSNNSQAVSIPDALASMATASAEHFTVCFKRIRKMFPDEVAEACLMFIASQELNAAGRSMALWLAVEGRYMNLLLASDALPIDVAVKALAALRTVDGDYLIRFLKVAEQLSLPPAILRALNLVPALGDGSLLIPWLRRLCAHNDQRVKSRAVKVLCELRPNKALIERQMLSEDARVRANAIEALWHSSTPEATALFQSATSDGNHRVVGNALIGLHLQGDPYALAKMIELTKSQDPFCRAAMAWCFGFIGDEGTIPLLFGLAQDSSVMVRKRALRSLLELQPREASGAPERPASPPVEQAPVKECKVLPKIERGLDLPSPSFASLT